jgi:hypothetical protein
MSTVNDESVPVPSFKFTAKKIRAKSVAHSLLSFRM